MIESGDDPSPLAITAATKAKPCVLSVAASTAVVGDIVIPRNTGWRSIDDRPFPVSVVTPAAITLGDSDTTDEVDAFASSGATLEQPVFLELCRSTFVVNQPAGAIIDVTTLCDDAHKIVSGLPAIATWTANGFYDYNDAAMWKARDYYRDGSFNAFKVTFRDGSCIAFSANVNVFDITTGINAAVTNNLGGQIDGLVSAFSSTGTSPADARAEAA